MDDNVTAEELEEALSLLHGESVSIEPARKKIVRHKGRMVEVEEAAYVKFSTTFKGELKDIGEHALKVFLYIGLSIGFETGSAHPGIRKIAEDTGMAQNTVLKAVQELEEKGFMVVQKKEKSSNVYTPVRYFSIGKSASPDDADITDDIPNLPQQNDNLPHENANLPQSSRVNLHNQINKNNNNNGSETKVSSPAKNKVPDNYSDEWKILAGEEITGRRDENEARMMDAANLICMGMRGVDYDIAYGVAYTFMRTRGIVIPESKIKSQRKPLNEMLEMHVLPDHVLKATKKLMDAGMTVTDLYSVARTAIDLANQPVKATKEVEFDDNGAPISY